MKKRKIETILEEFDTNFFNTYSNEIGVLDLTDGCSEQCSFCYMDPGKLNNYFDTENIINNLSNNKLFLQLLKPSIRIGYKSEPTDHKDISLIVKEMLKTGLNIRLITAVSKLRPEELYELGNISNEYRKTNNQGLKEFDLRVSVTSKNYQRIYSLFNIPNETPREEFIHKMQNNLPYPNINWRLKDTNIPNNLEPIGRNYSQEKYEEYINKGEKPLCVKSNGKLILAPEGIYYIKLVPVNETNDFSGRELIKLTNNNYQRIYNQEILSAKKIKLSS